jgi:hypothetical protein
MRRTRLLCETKYLLAQQDNGMRQTANGNRRYAE